MCCHGNNPQVVKCGRNVIRSLWWMTGSTWWMMYGWTTHLHRDPTYHTKLVCGLIMLSSIFFEIFTTDTSQFTHGGHRYDMLIDQFPKSHNAPFRTEICICLFWMEHCGIWNRCILGFVNQINCEFNGLSLSFFCPGTGLLILVWRCLFPYLL